MEDLAWLHRTTTADTLPESVGQPIILQMIKIEPISFLFVTN
ncbi:hypothetical protein NC652_004843 [Populus alba x Populus x berolinensis]|nr:hypothetical protein NC652_004843 [Populus alba x Populus x berolinensis]